MKSKNFIFTVCILATGIAAMAYLSTKPAGAGEGEKHYLFSYFKDGEVNVREGGKVKGGGKGLYLAWSKDGLQWKELGGGRPFFQPTVSRMLRDPFVAQGPDGIFHLVWTTGWNDRGIGYAASPDLIHWQDERVLPVMADEPDTLNCWAPEIFYDQAFSKFLVFWSSTVPGRFPETAGRGHQRYNHRIYSTTTKDFKTFTPTRLLYDPGFICIDADIVKAGDQYLMFLKADMAKARDHHLFFLKKKALGPPAKCIVMAPSRQAEGPYGPISEPITTQGAWAEGPSAIKIGERWFLYFDLYVLKRYGVAVSSDLRHWEDLSPKLQMPEGARHGNVFEVKAEVLTDLLKPGGHNLITE